NVKLFPCWIISKFDSAVGMWSASRYPVTQGAVFLLGKGCSVYRHSRNQCRPQRRIGIGIITQRTEIGTVGYDHSAGIAALKQLFPGCQVQPACTRVAGIVMAA